VHAGVDEAMTPILLVHGRPAGLHRHTRQHAWRDGRGPGDRPRQASGSAALHTRMLPGGSLSPMDSGTVEDAGTGADSRRGRPIRVVVAKPGLDGHDRGAKVVARALRDAGMEVIYTGLHQTPEQVVATALAEDADAVGLSILSGAHMTLFAKTVELLAAAGASDIVVFGGGIIPEADRAALAELGVRQVFTPGARMSDIVDWVRTNVVRQGDL
jgi:methylmalonyl-CoA mutase C-terminal domain/subunit